MEDENVQQDIARIYGACVEPLYNVLESIADDQINWKPAPHSRSVAEIARHLIRVDGWFLKEMGFEPEIDDPGQVGADEILKAMRRLHQQVNVILASCAEENDWGITDKPPELQQYQSIAEVIIHMAQHCLYHLSQMIYLRRAQDREWHPPLEQWEKATHCISDALVSVQGLQPRIGT